MINAERATPKYKQVYEILNRQIGGKWVPGTPIPPENELCESYGVSRTTVREAIQLLVREGRLKKQQGRRTVVTTAPHRVSRRSEDVLRFGFCLNRNQFFHDAVLFVQGLLNKINAWHETLQLFPFEDGIDQRDFVMRLLRKGWVDGLIVWPMGDFNQVILGDLREREFPFVYVEEECFCPAWEAAPAPLKIVNRVSHLKRALWEIARNYQSIVSIAPRQHGVNEARAADFADRHWANGKGPSVRILEVGQDTKGVEEVKRCLAKMPKPTAFVIETPQLAGVVACALDAMGPTDPAEVGVLQTGLPQMKDIFADRFSTVATRHEQSGAAAAKLLLDRLHGLVSTRQLVMDDDWIDRGTLNVDMRRKTTKEGESI